MTVHATTIAGIAPYFRSKKNKEYANHRKFHLRRTQTTPQPHVPMSVSDAESRQNNLRYSAMAASGKAIAAFVLAFTVSSKRLEYLEEAMGHFYVLKTDIEFCVMQNIIHFKKRDGDGGEKYESSKKIELLKLVAQIDNDMCKWRASLAKSKTVCG